MGEVVESERRKYVTLPELRMEGYYFGLAATGVREVDEILSAVACAGKAYHHTESWTDDCEGTEPSYAELISEAGARAAKAIQQARSQAIDDCIKVAGDGARAIPLDRDLAGRLVRESWVRWAREQPNPKPSWLVGYDDLSEADKEADRRIGEDMARWTLIQDAVRLASRLEALKDHSPVPQLEASEGKDG